MKTRWFVAALLLLAALDGYYVVFTENNCHVAAYVSCEEFIKESRR